MLTTATIAALFASDILAGDGPPPPFAASNLDRWDGNSDARPVRGIARLTIADGDAQQIARRSDTFHIVQ